MTALPRGGSARLATAAAVLSFFAAAVFFICSLAGSLLGYDYQAYAAAANRAVDGQALYDTSVTVAGPFAQYLYPPPFALAVVPFVRLAGGFGPGAWTVVLAAAFLAGVALLPVRVEVRLAIVLLAALDWPFLYSVKLGQVGPLLFLAFAAGWRWIDRPLPLGISVAAGTLIKVQPALLLAWALVTGRRRAAVLGILAMAAVALLSGLVVGFGAWVDFARVLFRVTPAVTTPHNFALGAIAYQSGVDARAASLLQVALSAGVIVFAIASWLRSDHEASYLVTVVASQLLSPLLWDHYGMLLLLPTAYLLERGQRWALLLPLAGWLPAPFVPLTFLVGLVAPPLVGRSRFVPQPAA